MRVKFTPRLTCHPATAVLLWLFFMVWMMDKPPVVLAAMSGLLLPGFNRVAWAQFGRYVRRSRWLLLVMLLVHAYSLPGAPLLPHWAIYSPSEIGVVSGLMQVWRLVLVLALLAVLMTRLTREALLSGIYSLMRYVCILGCSAERLAARIGLTLAYADALMHESATANLRQRLQQLRSPPSMNLLSDITMAQQSLRWLDYACWLMMIGLMGMAW
ncbi:MAG: hypothetical protein ABL868_04125 [Sulfuriferula sp.]